MLPMRASVARGHRCFSIGPLGLATSLSNGVGLAKEAASISAVLAGRAVQAVSGVKPEDVALNVMQRLDPETVKHMVSNAPCPMNAAAEKLAPLAAVFQKQPKRRRRRPRRRDDDHDVAALREEVAQLQKAQAELIELLRQQAEAQAQAQAQEIQAHSQQVSAAPSRTPPTPEECPATPPPTPSPEMPAAAPAPRPTLAASKVPKTSLSRAVNFTTLFARLAVDAGKRRVLGKPKSDPSPGVLSTKGLDLLVDRLCHMRGAALKLGQLLSIQDEGLVPKHVLEAFKRVRDRTNAMPAYQLNDIMSTELGPGWQDKFAEFDSDPVAAASLGQVHRARLHDGTAVAVKVQFSGVADSIASDVTNLRWVFSFGILPKGLYVENILRELQRELTRECDYEGEAHRQERYKARLESDPARHQGLRLVDVPDVHRSVSTQRVLTTTWVDGASADCLFAEGLPLAMRNEVGEAFLRLTLKELFEWRMMQTDPSFANFMYAHAERKLYLIDFGAAREYPKEFVERYFLIVYGSVVKDRQMVIDNSIKLGLLTGEECEEMLDAHVAAAEIASTPFSHRGAEDFAKFDISARMAPHVQTMLRLRLCAPPLEVYSLHRRLNGCFQWMAKLGSQVDCRRVFVDTMQQAVPHFSEDVRKQVSLTY
eukprot:TRINITY_DN16613_c0_g1_i1.p1 TRINITY_DN16613_c0_g1~~TRINITY_DN16613_c0_g1_i1.p1  ORF type:complete len:652 (+),score=209.40 TRINITY_DN16613_c0_g1_i1:115-2070(+)